MNEKEKEIQKQWGEGAVRDFIRRMLLYYDPMDLFVFAAPDDEYDSYVNKIFSFISQKIDQNSLEEKIFNLFENKEEDKKWRRKAKRMAEDLFDFLDQRDNFELEVQISPQH